MTEKSVFYRNLYKFVLTYQDAGAMRSDKEHTFRKIYDELFNSLVIHSVRIGVPFESAKDIVQECFIRLWENFSRIDSHSSYIFKAVRNSSINFLSSSKNSMQGKILHLEEINHSDTHEEERLAMERFHKVEEAYRKILSLTGKCREAFTMVYVHRMKIKDAAEELSVSENTLKTYLKRAKETLQKL